MHHYLSLMPSKIAGQTPACVESLPPSAGRPEPFFLLDNGTEARGSDSGSLRTMNVYYFSVVDSYSEMAFLTMCRPLTTGLCSSALEPHPYTVMHLSWIILHMLTAIMEIKTWSTRRRYAG